MKLRHLLITLIALCLPLRAATDLATLFAEDTTAAFSLPDAHAFDKMAEHPLVKAIATPELRKAFAPALAKLAEDKEKTEKIWKEEAGLSFDEARALMSGGVLAGLRVRVDDIMAAGPGVRADGPLNFMEFAVAAHFNGDEAAAEKYAKAYLRIIREAAVEAAKTPTIPPADPDIATFPADYEPVESEHAGAKLHLLKLKSGKKGPIKAVGWALLDKVVVVGMSERSLTDIIDRVKKGASSLADSTRFRGVVKEAKDADVIGFVDLAGLMGKIFTGMEEEAKKRGGTFSAFDPVKLMRAMGLDKLDAIYFTANFKGKGAVAEFGIMHHDSPAIMGLFAFDGPGKPPQFIPAEADSVGWQTMHLDRIFATVEKVINEGVPDFAPMFNSQLETMKKASSVDIKKDIFGQLGPEMWSATAPAGDKSISPAKDADVDAAFERAFEQSQVLGLKVKDAKAFELAVTSLINFAAPGKAFFENREVQGFTIKNVKDTPMPFGWLTTDEWLIVSVGPQGFLEKILARMKSGATDGVLAKSNVQDVLKALPGEDDGTTYMDFGAFIGNLIPVLKQMRGLGVLDGFVNFDALPEKMEIPVDLVTRQYVEPDGMRIKILMQEKAK